jgi:hypothetical protein
LDALEDISEVNGLTKYLVIYDGPTVEPDKSIEYSELDNSHKISNLDIFINHTKVLNDVSIEDLVDEVTTFEELDIPISNNNVYLTETHCYVVNNKNIDKIIASSKFIDSPIDTKIDYLCKKNEINVLVIYPIIANQGGSTYSSIQDLTVPQTN